MLISLKQREMWSCKLLSPYDFRRLQRILPYLPIAQWVWQPLGAPAGFTTAKGPVSCHSQHMAPSRTNKWVWNRLLLGHHGACVEEVAARVQQGAGWSSPAILTQAKVTTSLGWSCQISQSRAVGKGQGEETAPHGLGVGPAPWRGQGTDPEEGHQRCELLAAPPRLI